jgi:hypothetical protein
MCLNEFGSTDIALYGGWKRKFVNMTVRIYVLRDVKTCTVAGVPTFRRDRLLPAPCTLIYEGGVFCPDNNFVPHYRAARPSHPRADTTNRRLPQGTVNILSSFTTISVWETAVCPQDITAVTKCCATSFSSGILSGAPVMSRAHNNAPARLQVFK